MKKTLTTAVMAALLAIGTTGAFAGADGECSVAKAAMSADCATACSSGSVAAAEGVAVGMAKGGAEKGTVTAGYSVGSQVPNFTLSDTTGKSHNLTDFRGKVSVLVFYNQACPFVVEVADRLGAFTKEYSEKGVAVIAIDSGVNNAAEKIAEHAKGVAYPILVNNDSSVARNFKATRTPEVFILDKEGVIQYHGMFDTGQTLDESGNRATHSKNAVDALLAGKPVEVKETKAFGCTIKFNDKTAAAPAAKSSSVTGG